NCKRASAPWPTPSSTPTTACFAACVVKTWTCCFPEGPRWVADSVVPLLACRLPEDPTRPGRSRLATFILVERRLSWFELAGASKMAGNELNQKQAVAMVKLTLESLAKRVEALERAVAAKVSNRPAKDW